MNILEGKDITKLFIREGFLGSRSGCVEALKGVDFKVGSGEILGIVGESGSGKSTLARIICSLETPTSGSLIWDEKVFKGEKRKAHPAQMVFQNPYGSLNPKLTVGYMLREAVSAGSLKPIRNIKEDEIRKVLENVGLEEISLVSYPHQFSGGQKQRLGIARALALNPRLLVCDEPVSALDISVQAQILELIRLINSEKGIPVVFIAHDIEVVSMISSSILVMKDGRVVEYGDAANIINSPSAAYTRKLIEAVPVNPYM